MPVKFALKSKVNNTGKKIEEAIIFFAKLILIGEKCLACLLHKKQAYVQEKEAPKAEIIPVITYK